MGNFQTPVVKAAFKLHDYQISQLLNSFTCYKVPQSAARSPAAEYLHVWAVTALAPCTHRDLLPASSVACRGWQIPWPSLRWQVSCCSRGWKSPRRHSLHKKEC